MGHDEEKDWQHGLCGCFSNIGVAIVTFFLPCYTAGRVASKVDDSCICHSLLFLIPGVGCFCGALERHKLRERQNIGGSMFCDCIIWYTCPLLALAQEAQEVDAISFVSKKKKSDEEEQSDEGKPLKLERK